VIVALALASVAAVAAIYDRFQLLRRRPRRSRACACRSSPALDADDLDAARRALDARPGSAARALTEVLESLPRGPEAAGEHLAAALSDERRRLEHRLLLLGTLGNNAPFIRPVSAPCSASSRRSTISRRAGRAPRS